VCVCPWLVGGFDGNHLHTAEVYDTNTNMWNPVSSMLTPRSNFGIEVINNRLFVAGGFNGLTTTFNVESYDAITNEWSAACDMGIFRSALSFAVVLRRFHMLNISGPLLS
uniref:Uncharacterized protein n=1 Tax=Amphilophus citrinellus TaxID=61819 RepID=A0A3Q0QUQ6_AMPCI